MPSVILLVHGCKKATELFVFLSMRVSMYSNLLEIISDNRKSIPLATHEKVNGHRELTVTTVVTAPGPNDHGSVTARLGHSSVTARSQLSHG